MPTPNVTPQPTLRPLRFVSALGAGPAAARTDGDAAGQAGRTLRINRGVPADVRQLLAERRDR